jgi:monofunctional biosynthetic peptidoglycan transglycosylase
LAKKKTRGGVAGRLVRGLVALLVIGLFIGPVAMVVVYRFVPPPLTYLMVQRMFEGHGVQRRWVPLSRISPHLVRTVIAAEDARFCEHHGFDFGAIEKAMEANARGKRLRGGSTITQQTAKNVFLWPDRSYVRKGLEAYFTVLIEALWGKRRILEVYLNVAEWGQGIYGAEAAAQRYFGRSAKDLTASQAALLAVTLPNPGVRNPAKPSGLMRSLARTVAARARVAGDYINCLYP